MTILRALLQQQKQNQIIPHYSYRPTQRTQKKKNGKIKPKGWQHEGDPVGLRREAKHEPRKELGLQEVKEARTINTSQ